MATYKVIQDIEAEDKLLGPLTFRQFVYAGICVSCLFLSWFVFSRGAGFLVAIFLPPAVVSGFFAYPWGRDQPTEVWALAKIRFMFKPRRRVWDQSGTKELVTVTAPKQEETDYTKGLSQTEVKSRLHALADTIDSRGWAIKGSNVNLAAQPDFVVPQADSDRLVAPSDFPQQVSSTDVNAADDMLDEQNNPRAQRVNNLINQSSKARRQKMIDTLQQPDTPQQTRRPASPANNYWFLNQPGSGTTVPGGNVTFNTQVVTPGTPATAQPAQVPVATAPLPAQDEASLVQELEARKAESPMKSYYEHMRTIQPLSEQRKQQKQAAERQAAIERARAKTAAAAKAAQSAPRMTPAQQAAVRQLATNNDLNVATIAREAANRSGQLQNEEVVIKLH